MMTTVCYCFASCASSMPHASLEMTHVHFIFRMFFFFALMTDDAMCKNTVRRFLSRVLIIPKAKKKRKTIFYRANVFLRGVRRVEGRNSLPSNFFCLYNESARKSSFSFSTIIFYQKNGKRRKNYELLLPFRFFPLCFSRKTENITMSGKKLSACAIHSQKNSSVSFFLEKKVSLLKKNKSEVKKASK